MTAETVADTAKVAVVSGAASGIGAAIAARLTDNGWRVAGLDLADVRGAALSVRVDLSDPTAVGEAITTVEQRLGAIDAVISAAGHYAMEPFERISPEQWHRMLRVHVGGLLNLVRGAVPQMQERRSGCVVAIGSELAIGGGSGDAHYAAAKGAVHGLVRSLAAELAETGIRVNAVAPGPTDTPLLTPDSPWRAPSYLATLPLGRLVRPAEVASIVAFLVEEGTFVTGEIVSPNAGAVI